MCDPASSAGQAGRMLNKIPIAGTKNIYDFKLVEGSTKQTEYELQIKNYELSILSL